MIAVAAIYLVLIFRIERRGEIVDATFIPFLLSGGLFILGIMQLVTALRISAIGSDRKSVSEKAEDACEDKKSKVDTPTVIKTIALILIYIAFLDLIGFVIMSIVYLFTQFIVLTPVNSKKKYLAYAVISVVTSVSIYLIFRYVFSMMLPEGLLK